MKRVVFLFLSLVPLGVAAQNEVAPEGYKLLWVVVISVAIPVVYYFIKKILQKPGSRKGKPVSVSRRKLKIDLLKDRTYRPNVLTLNITNNSKKDIDLEAPVLCFRKIWSKRKFKLKGINRYEIYPLYLEAGKTHELRIDLGVFFNHDRTLKRFYWAKIRVWDTKGKKYSSSYITLRKSLFS
ncbi:hypothetical protein [Sunxiuqinia dokdonensis]|uniref:Uncharacterized protein n=1 Tax=Sunxiuqinia dokdonensis TaxID=1409788 RepID=A0A0L8V9Y4_9BACT|nr:hypothetical protein [Sunxiuqinia dokdonensis]KOH45285.1 hypothetical protein NC99_18930 [Sunxiuqinia dokdonensis]